MKYLKNIEDGSIQAVEEGSPAEAALKALRTTPDSTKAEGFPLYEEVAGPGTPAVDISGIPTWVAAAFSEGAIVKYAGKLYIAKGAVAADAAAPDTDTDDWDLIGPSPPSGGSGVALGASIAIGDGFRNVSFATPGPLSGLASWQAPIDADFYAVQVRASGFEPVAQVADVYVIRDDAHWQDFFWGDQNEVTQSLAVSIGAAAGAVTVTTFTAFVPAGWYLVGHGSDDMGFYGTHAIPVGPD